MRALFLSAGFVLAFALSACDSTGIDGDFGGGDATLDIDPRQTYLHTSDDQAVDAPAVSLADLGYDPGEAVCFRVDGDFSLAESYSASQRGDGYLTAVFSSSDTLGLDAERYRVSGAIEAGDDVVTLATEQNALATDIDQDFRADDVCLMIPDGAEYVFFAAYDSLYGDNGSIDGTPFQVRIET